MSGSLGMRYPGVGDYRPHVPGDTQVRLVDVVGDGGAQLKFDN